MRHEHPDSAAALPAGPPDRPVLPFQSGWSCPCWPACRWWRRRPRRTHAGGGPGTVAGEPIDGRIEPLADLPTPEVPAERPSLAGGTPPAAYSIADLGNGPVSNASGVNEEGHVSGTLFNPEGESPVVWQGDQMVRLDTDGAGWVRARAIGDDGTVGGWLATGKRYAASWTRDEDGEYGELQRISDVTSHSLLHGGEVRSVGDGGSLLVTDPREHVPFGFDLVWRHGGVGTEIGPLSPEQPYLGTYDMNGTGQVTSMVSDGRTNADAAIWYGGFASSLPDPLPDATLTRGLAVNDVGDVVVESTRSGIHVRLTAAT